MKLHPFSWVLISLWITSIAVLSTSLSILCIMIVVALAAGFLSRGKAMFTYLKGLKRLTSLILTLFVVQMVFRRNGDIVFSLGFVHIYSDGLTVALEVSLRLIILLISAGILGRLSFIDFKNAFLLLPQELSFMISYVVHLIPLLRSRFLHYLLVLRLRGLQMKDLKLSQRFKLYRIISLSVLGSMLHISQRQAVALELRGFRSQGKKTFLYKERIRFWDVALYILLAFISLSYYILMNYTLL